MFPRCGGTREYCSLQISQGVSGTGRQVGRNMGKRVFPCSVLEVGRGYRWKLRGHPRGIGDSSCGSTMTLGRRDGRADIRGVPWGWNPGAGVQLGDLHVRFLNGRRNLAEDNERDINRMQLTCEDFLDHGYMEGCPGCQAVVTRTSGQGHSGGCRTRMEEAVTSSAEGHRRADPQTEKENGKLARKIEECAVRTAKQGRGAEERGQRENKVPKKEALQSKRVRPQETSSSRFAFDAGVGQSSAILMASSRIVVGYGRPREDSSVVANTSASSGDLGHRRTSSVGQVPRTDGRQCTKSPDEHKSIQSLSRPGGTWKLAQCWATQPGSECKWFASVG